MIVHDTVLQSDMAGQIIFDDSQLILCGEFWLACHTLMVSTAEWRDRPISDRQGLPGVVMRIHRIGHSLAVQRDRLRQFRVVRNANY